MDVDVHCAQAVARFAGVLAILDEANDPALLHTEIVDAYVVQLRKLPPQPRTKRLDPCFDHVDANPHRIAGGDSQADLTGVGSLPILEPTGVVADGVPVSVDPGSGLEINKRRLQLPDGCT